MAAATVSSGHRVAVAHPGRLTDVAIVSAAFVGSLLAVLNGGFGVTHQGPAATSTVAVVLVAGCTLPLLGWRHTPLTAFIVTGAANVALAAIVYPIGLPLGPGVAIYAMAASRELATPWLTRTTTMVTALFGAYLVAGAIVERTFPWVELLHGALLWAAFWFAGERARLRREQIAELKREARRERQLATAEERARIARDLHDSAGHAINVIGVRAGAARLRHHQDPERSLVALEAIEELARQTAADIDRLVGVLRSPDDRDPIVAPTGLASVPSLIAHHRAAGLDVTHRVAGAPRTLSSVVDQAAYRIIQEALTNASRHGLGSADMAFDYGDAFLEITVTNPITEQPVHSDARHGLVGARERADLLGGTLITGRNGPTHVLRARLPYEPAS